MKMRSSSPIGQYLVAKPYLCLKAKKMNTSIKIPLRSLNPAVVHDLQEQYPSAMVHVELSNQIVREGMDENRFWELISLLDWKKSGDDDAVSEPVVQALADSTLRHIYEFEDILSEKLYLLDGMKFAKNTGENAYRGADVYFSVDGFLYDRCCVVANGKEFYQEVLKDPEKMPKEMDFEPLLGIAAKAYQRKTGKEFKYVPAYSYETFSNLEGWNKD